MQAKEPWKANYLNTNSENINENCAKSIRKSKKEEILQLKRSANKKGDQLNCDIIISKYIPEFQAASTLKDKVNAILSAHPILNEEAMYNSIEFMRHSIAQEEKMVLDTLHIITIEIKKSHSLRCKSIAILALVNFTAESTKYSPIIASDTLLVSEIVSNLKSADTDLSENCLTCLGNLCSDSMVARDILGKSLHLSTITGLLNEKILISPTLFMIHMMLLGTHTYIEYLPALSNLIIPFLKYSNDEIIGDAFLIIARIIALSKSKHPSYSSQINYALECISSAKDEDTLYSLRFLTEVVGECHDSFAIALLDMKLIPMLNGALNSGNRSIVRQSCRLINALSQKHAVDMQTAGTLKKLVDLTANDICDTSRFALWSILEIVQNLPYDNIKLIDLSIVYTTCNKIIKSSLDFTQIILSYLKACDKIFKSEGDNVEFLDLFIMCDSEELLNKLDEIHDLNITAFVGYIREEFLINKYSSLDL